ncbi:MAG: TonB family protein [Bryobacteraceae bacterium]
MSDPEEGLVLISIRRSDLAIDKLVCLGRKLRETRPRWRTLGALIFTSREAARYYKPGQECESAACVKRPDELHAIYGYGRDGHKESLEILPEGEGAESLKTTLDIATGSNYHCRLEMAGRCLLSLERPDYPAVASKPGTSGRVVLTGTIGRDGKIRRIRAEESDASVAEERKAMENEARQNLSTWQLDARPREDPIRITYSYQFMSRPTRIGWTRSVEYDLPNQVVIRIGQPD